MKISNLTFKTLRPLLLLLSLLAFQAGAIEEDVDLESSVELIVAHTWDGKKLAEDQQATIFLRWLEDGNLRIAVDAPFANDPKPDCQSVSCWKLWDFEVVELFLVGSGEPAPYVEVEISPWGNHLVLQLLGSRNLIDKHLPLNLSVKRDGDRWTAEAILSKELIPPGVLKANAYRVTGIEPSREYHVMTPMVSAQPDFHLIDQFDMQIDRSE